MYGALTLAPVGICEALPRAPRDIYGALPRAPVKGLFEKSPLTIPKNFCPDTAIKNPPQGCRISGKLEKAQKKVNSLLCFFCRYTDGFTVRPCGIMFNLQFLISMGSYKSAIDTLISVALFI